LAARSGVDERARARRGAGPPQNILENDAATSRSKGTLLRREGLHHTPCLAAASATKATCPRVIASAAASLDPREAHLAS